MNAVPSPTSWGPRHHRATQGDANSVWVRAKDGRTRQVRVSLRALRSIRAQVALTMRQRAIPLRHQ